MRYRRAIVFGLLLYVALQKTRPVEAGGTGTADPAYYPAPRIVQCTQNEGTITLEWQADSSAAIWEIYRADNGEIPALVTRINDPVCNYWTDSSAEPGQYVYYIKAIKAAGGQVAWSGPSKISLEEEAFSGRVQFDDIRHDTEKRRIYFKWTAPAGDLLSYRILVTEGGSTYTLCRVDGLTTEYVYKYSQKLKNPTFSIIAMNANGRLSAQ